MRSASFLRNWNASLPPSGDHLTAPNWPCRSVSALASPPPNRIRCICGPSPPRSEINAIVPPSGDHCGAVSRWSPRVYCRGVPPPVGAIHRFEYFFSVALSTRSTA